tara:strand:+ start:3408 stop:4613 length:1206 start_codon:yes stop_codon:yes gene_type:complete
MNIYEYIHKPFIGINIYSFVIFLILLFIIVAYAYIKINYRFWSIQPVFHIYNVYYWAFPPGLIKHDLPEKNKFVNTKNILFRDFSVIDKKMITSTTHLIQDHYLKIKEAHYNPSENNFVPYFKGHNDPSFLSTYFYKDHLNNKEIVGTMTSRPLFIKVYDKKMNVFYVDHLCVHSGYRKKGIAPELIQTHNYFQCRANKKIPCSLFKKETDLTGIVPLTVYKTYCFDMKLWKQNYKIHNSIELIQVNSKNIHLLYDFLTKMVDSDKYTCFIMPAIGNIQSLIETKNIYVFMSRQKGEILSVYFFRDSSLTYNKEGVIECFCNICNINDKDMFVYIFSEALKRLLKEMKNIRYLLIENNSDTKEILVNIMTKYNPLFETPTAYYLYNYGVRPVEEFRVCIIN